MPTPGPLELIIILVIALLILGPGKLPDVGAALGKSIREFRKASSDVQEAVKIDTSPMAPAASSAATCRPPDACGAPGRPARRSRARRRPDTRAGRADRLRRLRPRPTPAEPVGAASEPTSGRT